VVERRMKTSSRPPGRRKHRLNLELAAELNPLPPSPSRPTERNGELEGDCLAPHQSSKARPGLISRDDWLQLLHLLHLLQGSTGDAEAR
jgi:hypothetical protein